MYRRFSEDSLGLLFIGFTIATWLFGANSLQVISYFQAYNDRFLLKAAVVVVFLSDLLNSILNFWGIYLELISDPLVPLHGNVPMVLESTASDIAIFIVQCFFAQSVYQVSRHNKWLAVSILVLAMLGFAVGIALTVASICSLRLTGKELPTINEVLLAVSLGLVTLTDVIITVSLVWYLFDKKSITKQVSHLLDRLIVYCVQRGILTTICHTVVLVLWFSLPTKWAWTVVQFSLGKVYTFTFLMLLNRRESLRSFRASHRTCSDIKFEDATHKLSTISRSEQTDGTVSVGVQSTV